MGGRTMGTVASVTYILIFLSVVSPVSTFAPLGSEPVERCHIHSYECPSHYICVAYDGENYGRCFCDRFYGFYGPTCEKLSIASYLLMGVCVTNLIMMGWALFMNMNFAYSLHRTGSLQQNTLCRCLFFNILMVLPLLTLACGCLGILTSVDKRMIFHQYLSQSFYTLMLLTTVLSTMSISLAWIETVEKTRRRESHSHWKYKLILYGISIFAVVISVISFHYSLFSFVELFEGLIVSFSYFEARRVVTKALSVMEDNGDIVVYQGASDVLHSIKHTSKQMIIYSLFLSFSCLVIVLTTTLKRPMYEEQNELPRYTQGQFGFLLVQLALYKINLTLLEYLKSSARRQLARPVINRSYCQGLKAFCSCLCCWSSYCKDDGGMNIYEQIELEHGRGQQVYDEEDSMSSSISLSSLNETSENRSSKDSSSDGHMRTKVKQNEYLPHIDRPNLSTSQFELSHSTKLRRGLSSLFLPNQGTAPKVSNTPLTPFALVTISLHGYISQVRLLVATSKGTLAGYVATRDSGDPIKFVPSQPTGASSGSSDSCQLLAGSHAFVKCYGEPFIRCCLDSFRFGFAVGHELLGSHSEMSMMGEIEVNEEGIVTRWLNKCGLYIPPRYTINQSGLPLELAWLCLSEHEVSTIKPHHRDVLQLSGSLINISDIHDTPVCVRIEHGATDNAMRQQQNVRNVAAGNVIEIGPPVRENVKQEDRLGGTCRLNRDTSVMCSWILKASADTENSWHLSVGTSAYVLTIEAVARMRNKVRKLLEKSHAVVPSDILYDSSTSFPISELTEFSDAEQFFDNTRDFPLDTNNDPIDLNEPFGDEFGEKNSLQLQQDEESVSDMSSITMSSTASQQYRDAPTPYALRVPSQVAESNNEDSVAGEHDSAEGVEQDGISLSGVSLGSSFSTTSSVFTPLETSPPQRSNFPPLDSSSMLSNGETADASTFASSTPSSSSSGIDLGW